MKRVFPTERAMIVNSSGLRHQGIVAALPNLSSITYCVIAIIHQVTFLVTVIYRMVTTWQSQLIDTRSTTTEKGAEIIHS